MSLLPVLPLCNSCSNTKTQPTAETVLAQQRHNFRLFLCLFSGSTKFQQPEAPLILTLWAKERILQKKHQQQQQQLNSSARHSFTCNFSGSSSSFSSIFGNSRKNWFAAINQELAKKRNRQTGEKTKLATSNLAVKVAPKRITGGSCSIWP